MAGPPCVLCHLGFPPDRDFFDGYYGGINEILETIPENTNRDTLPREVWGQVREIMAEKGMTHRDFQTQIGTQYCGSTLFKSAPGHERLQRVAAILESDDLEMLATNDVYWDEIVSIEHQDSMQVFDAEVFGTHNFIADGVVVHNSLEQDADMLTKALDGTKYRNNIQRVGMVVSENTDTSVEK